jgi:RNA polymerase-interacting CarD/CdnL/TRCF family regulator
MNTRLENSICTLKILRDTYHSQLDNCAVSELNAVIIDLETLDDQARSEQRKEILSRALQVMASIINLVSNLKDLM